MFLWVVCCCWMVNVYMDCHCDIDCGCGKLIFSFCFALSEYIYHFKYTLQCKVQFVIVWAAYVFKFSTSSVSFFNMCLILSFSIILRHHVQQYIMYAECFDCEWCPFQFQAVYYDCKWKSDSSHSCDTKQSTSGQFSAEEWMCTVSTWFGVILSVSSHLFKF